MKKIMVTFVMLIFLASSTAVYAADVNDDNPKAVTIMAVTKERDGMTVESEFRCSGFYIVGGYVVTVAHLFEDEITKYDVYDGPNYARLTFIAKDDKRDLALFRVPDTLKHGYYDIADSIAMDEALSSVVSTRSDEFVKQTGKVTALKKEAAIGRKELLSDTFRMFATMTTVPGNSGSPVMNKDGEIVGVVVAMTKDGQTICATLEDVKDFLNTQIPNRIH